MDFTEFEISKDEIKRRFGPVIYQRGVKYFKQDRVKLQSVTLQSFTAKVEGTYIYTVEGKLLNNRITLSCDCPYYTYCKHEVASLLALQEYLQVHGDLVRKEKTEPPWELFFKRIFIENEFQYKQSPSKAKWQVAFIMKTFWDGWELVPQKMYIRKDGMLGRTENITAITSNMNNLLYADNDPFIISYLTQNLTAYDRYYYNQYLIEYGDKKSGRLFDLLKNSLLFLITDEALSNNLEFSESMAHIEFTLVNKNEFMQFIPMIQIADKKEPIDSTYKILTENPTWILKGNALYKAANCNNVNLLLPFTADDLKIKIPRDEAPHFIEKVYGEIDSVAKVNLPHSLKVRTISNFDKKRVYLKEDSKNLQVYIRFCYDEKEFDFFDVTDGSYKSSEEGFEFFKIQRDFKKENEIYNQLIQLGLRENRNGYLYVSKSKARDWLFDNLPLLASEGFDIFGQEKLKTLKVRATPPRIELSVESKNDWFDLNVKIDFDGLRLSLKEIKKEIGYHKSYIQLADGSAARLPDDWRKKLNYILNIGEVHEDKLRLSEWHIPAIDAILEQATTKHTDDFYEQRIKKLRNFQGVVNVPVPKVVNGKLRSYQHEGYNWLNFLQEFRFGGCLADDMGLGKTLQALTLLQHEKDKKNGLPSLIVCPTSVVFNWECEADKFTPDLKLYQHVGIERDKELSDFAEYDLIITTYGILLRDILKLKIIQFHYVILDESQKIKNPTSKTAKAARLLRANHRLVMTGTPIENNSLELWSQFSFLNPGLLGSLNFFRKSFATPIEKRKDKDSALLLKKMIYPFILRRTKENVAKELPPKTEKIYYCNMSKSQQKMYTKWRDYYRAMVLDKIDDIGLDKSRMNVLQGLVKLRQIACHPNLVDITVWEDSGKFESLKEIIEEVISENHKVLVFSQFVKMLKLIRKFLDQRLICYEYLDGHTRNRQQCVERFQNHDDVKIFLISLKAGGTGINLTAADYVIHYDPWWNPAVEMQATDRTHRIGQDKKVFVYRMITKDTVEEKILDLQKRKSDLISNLITTDTSLFKSLTREDIEALFS